MGGAHDEITNPEHYTQGDIQPLDYAHDHGWLDGACRTNILKYITRCDFKGSPVKDLQKARRYLDILIDIKQKEEFEGDDS